MTINKILNSIQSIEKLMNLELPFKEAYRIYSLTKEINDAREFFIKEERKLIEKYNAEIAENGEIKFNSVEDKNSFIKEYDDLKNLELNEFKPLEINISILDKINFTPIDFIALDGVINFID